MICICRRFGVNYGKDPLCPYCEVRLFMANNNKRPVFLNLARIHFPVTAVLSIAHRLTGLLLFLLIPLVIWLLQLSLHDVHGYHQVLEWSRSSLARPFLILALWFLAHHFFAGLRYLLLDIDIGIEPAASRRGAWIVIVAGIVTMLIAAVVLF